MTPFWKLAKMATKKGYSLCRMVSLAQIIKCVLICKFNNGVRFSKIKDILYSWALVNNSASYWFDVLLLFALDCSTALEPICICIMLSFEIKASTSTPHKTLCSKRRRNSMGMLLIIENALQILKLTRYV